MQNQTDNQPTERASAAVEALAPAANFHLWQPCNMRCRGCFARFEDVRASVLPKGHMDKDAAARLTRILARHFDKITFVGGEPTLCPWLIPLLEVAKAEGAVTMLVTNGSRLTPAYLDVLAGSLDWLTLSVDSVNPAIHEQLGRAVRGRAIATPRYIEMSEAARQRGMRIKINTVVSRLTMDEDFGDFIRRTRPERWKVFQVLPVDGQNDGSVEDLLIEPAQFQSFVDRHEAQGLTVISESNEEMRGTYAMVDPAGRFFDSTSGFHRYSQPILQVGLRRAWDEVRFDHSRFVRRRGLYQWRGSQ